jgi:hypothetical protein
VLALVLILLLVTSGAVGVVFAPNTRGRDLEQIQHASLRERQQAGPRQSAPG